MSRFACISCVQHCASRLSAREQAGALGSFRDTSIIFMYDLRARARMCMSLILGKVNVLFFCESRRVILLEGIIRVAWEQVGKESWVCRFLMDLDGDEDEILG